MNKRNLAVILWFVVGWQFGGVLVQLVALPWMLGFVPGVALALLVLSGRFVLFTPRATTRRKITPINEFAAQLDRRAASVDKRIDHWPVVETTTKRV